MELAPVTEKDLEPLAELARACCPELGWLNAAVLSGQTFGDSGCDPSLLLQGLEGGAPIAAALAVVRKGPSGPAAYFKFFGVHPLHRRRHHGDRLFDELERRCQALGAREVHVGWCAPPYLLDGVNSLETASVSFLLERGYQRGGDAIDMEADLSRARLDLGPEDQAKIRAFQIRRAAPGDLGLVLELVRTAFPQWGWEVEVAARQGDLFLAEKDGKAVAFACANATHRGWFGPTGTLPSERGQGLGRILLVQALAALKQQGHAVAVIPWVGPIAFYARHAAARIAAVRWHFAKGVSSLP